MPTPEEQFTEALRDVNDTLEEVKVVLVQVRDVTNIEPIDAENVPNRVMVTDGSGNTTTSSITATELNYLDNLTGNVQSQLDNKLAKNIGTLNSVVITDGYGNVTVHPKTTATELDYLDGVTSNIQVQFANTQTALNAKTDKHYFHTDGYARKLIQKVSTGTENVYVKLCTWTTTQDGQKLMIKGAGSSGFNAYSIQQFELGVNVNTSNGHDDGAGQGYFSGQCYMHDMQNHRDNVRVYLIQPSSTVCEVWVKLPEYCTMVYEILVSSNNSVDTTPFYQASAPTTDTKYIYAPAALANKTGWTKGKVLVSNANGIMAAANTTTTELHHLVGVTSNVQTQLDGKSSRTGWDASRVLATNESGTMYATGVTVDELSYLKGSTSSIQTQLNDKQPKNIGTANRALVSNGSGEISVSGVTASELNMLKNVKSNLQTQIDDKQSQITSINGKVGVNTLVGEVKWLAFSDSVGGWLLCDGRAVSRTDYAALFAVIGTTWGEGDGSTTFNLPNLIDKTVWGGATAGSYKEAGLPNVEGELSNFVGTVNPTVSGVLSIAGTGTTRFTQEASGDYATHRMRVDASSDIYGKSETVQPPAAVLRPVIKY